MKIKNLVSALFLVVSCFKVSAAVTASVVTAPTLEGQIAGLLGISGEQLASGISTMSNTYANWLKAIDTVYNQYDQIVRMIEMIENQYETIKQAVEAAKNVDWSKIEFDGDFDIRDDIRRVNARVNSFLGNIRRVKETLTADCLIIGDDRYSIADLCTLDGEGKFGLLKFAGSTKEAISKTLSDSIDAIEGNLTQSQRVAIMRKYGISPRNYLFAQQTEALLQQKIGEQLALASEELQKDMYSKEEKELLKIVAEVSKVKDSNGNITAGALAQGQFTLQQKMIHGLIDLKDSFNRVGGLIAAHLAALFRKEEATAANAAEIEHIQSVLNDNVPLFFRKN